MKFFLKIGGLFALLFISLGALAIESPITELNQVANQMINQLESNKAQLRTSAATATINHIVDQVLVPHVDVDRMAAAVVGRQYWYSATPVQKQAFIREFKQLLISTYASALASYDGDRVEFYPLRERYTASPVILARSMIIRRNGQRINVDYNLVRSGSVWRVYDYSIDNISMVQSYRAQFANVLASGGMDALLQRLSAHNRQSV